MSSAGCRQGWAPGRRTGLHCDVPALLPDFYGKGGQLRGSGTSPTALGMCSTWACALPGWVSPSARLVCSDLSGP